MNKAWKIGTEIYNYLELLLDNDYWDKVLKIKKDGIYIDDKIVIKKSGGTNSQLARVLQYSGLLIPSIRPTKVKEYGSNSITFKIISKPESVSTTIINHILDRMKIYTEIEDTRFRSEEFRLQEEEFIFSLLSSAIKENDKASAAFIEMSMDGTKIANYAVYYKKYINFLATNPLSAKLISFAKENIFDDAEKINEVIEGIKVNGDYEHIEEMYIRPSLDDVLTFDSFSLGFFIKEHLSGDSKIKIPIYQRKYRWSKENVNRLLIDVKNVVNHHNIGLLITKMDVKGNKTYMKIIDGQQRLTTLMLIVRASYDYTTSKKWSAPYMINSLFDIEDNENDASKTFTRIEGNDDFESFRRIMKGENIEDASTNSIIYRNYFRTLQWISSNIKTLENMKRFWKNLLNRLIFATLTDGSSDEYQLFEKLNTGAIPLKPMELVKNKILNDFKEIVDKNEKHFQDKFENKILSNFEKKGELDDSAVKQFIINLNRIYGFEIQKDESLFDAYMKLISSIYVNEVEDYPNNIKAYDDILEQMNIDILLYKDISERKRFVVNSHRFYFFSDYLNTFASRDVYTPILFKLFKEFVATENDMKDVNNLRRILNVIETYEIRFQIVSYRGQSLGKILAPLVDKISLKSTPEDVFKMFNELKTNSMPSKAEFEQMATSFQFSNSQANNITLRIESFLFAKGIDIDKSMRFPNIDLKKLSREHIMPQAKDNWIGEIFESEKKIDSSVEYEKVIDKYDKSLDLIGNALPIEAWKNSKLGNLSYEEKLGEYNKNKSVPILGLYSGVKDDEFLPNIVIDPVTNGFDLEKIQKRTKAITKLMARIWDDV